MIYEQMKLANMNSMEQESWYIGICDELDTFLENVDKKIEQQQQQMKACKKRNEFENKLAQERKLKADLTEQLAELNRKGDELEKACVNFSRLTITENDQQRLDNTKELFTIAKELTGIRFDFSSPPNIMKGYIKNESRRLLLPFEMEANSEALWDLLKSASDVSLPDKENRNPN